ncbi:MAG: ETC complex I subunit [Pseudomonadota bacterium]
MSAKIYQPAKTAMQSGKAKTGKWLLEFDPAEPRRVEPLMGYTSSADMNAQVKLKFETREEAVDYATRNDIAYRVIEPKMTRRRAMSYSENFAYNRVMPWTH